MKSSFYVHKHDKYSVFGGEINIFGFNFFSINLEINIVFVVVVFYFSHTNTLSLGGDILRDHWMIIVIDRRWKLVNLVHQICSLLLDFSLVDDCRMRNVGRFGCLFLGGGSATPNWTGVAWSDFCTALFRLWLTDLPSTWHPRIVLLPVSQHWVLEGECPLADVTGVGPFTSVGSNVPSEILSWPELPCTKHANDFSVDVVRKLASQLIKIFLLACMRL